MDYKVQWEQELERRAVLGITAPDPIPHPDQVHIDPRTGAVAFRGPMTRKEKVELDASVRQTSRRSGPSSNGC